LGSISKAGFSDVSDSAEALVETGGLSLRIFRRCRVSPAERSSGGLLSRSGRLRLKMEKGEPPPRGSAFLSTALFPEKIKAEN